MPSSEIRPRFITLVLLAAICIGTVIFSCSGDTDFKAIDFSKRISVSQPAPEKSAGTTLRVAVAAMISPKETVTYYHQLLNYIGAHLDRPIQLVQRKTYGEINELFPKKLIDLAFICTGPYALGKDVFGFEALATPVVRREPFYHSYLIVNKSSPIRSLEELKDRTFAFTDPESNTGALVPRYWLARIGERPDDFFGNVIYTYSHNNSILAVAKSMVDGATVDGHIWEYYHRRNPYYTAMTRIIKKSEPFGSPPLVASVYLPEKLKQTIRQLLLAMHLNSDGRQILDHIMIDRFVEPREEWYQSVPKMFAYVQNPTQTHAGPQVP